MSSLVYLAVAVLAGQVSAVRQPARSVRIGDFLVTATRVWLPADVPKNLLGLPDRDHLVVVEVNVKNVSEKLSQTTFSPHLTVKPYADYQWYPWTRAPAAVMKPPNLYQLLPGEESKGAYVFEVRNDTTPSALVLEYKAQKASIGLAGVLGIEGPK